MCLALAAIWSGLARRPIAGLQVPASPALNSLGATFVTLELGGALLGCIGTLEAVRPLYEDVMQNAYRSAFADPRLPPIESTHYAAMDVTVSVLTPLERIELDGRDGLQDALRPRVDGLLLTDGTHRSTFLPAVWEKVQTPRQFLELLLIKGGWPAGTWPASIDAYRYRTVEFTDRGPRPTGLSPWPAR